MRALHNACAGRRCFIIATGPSLTPEDVNALKDEITFSINSCFKLFDQTDWRPDFYALTDSKVFRDLREGVVQPQFKTVFCTERTDCAYRCERKFWLPVNARGQGYRYRPIAQRFPRLFPWAFFSDRIDRNVFLGRTVVYVVLQIAAYMGFSEIYLLGADCDYTGDRMYADQLHYERHTWSDFDRRTKAETGGDMIRSYEVARKYAEKHGIRIYNATRGGKLEVFPRVRLEDIL